MKYQKGHIGWDGPGSDERSSGLGVCIFLIAIVIAISTVIFCR